MKKIGFLFRICILVVFSACGVKGKPLPPLVAPPLGRGEPSFPEATQNLQIKKKKPVKIEGDFEDPVAPTGDRE